MKSSPLVSFQSVRCVALVCICTFAIYGCSGSSDSGSGDAQSGGESAAEAMNVSDGAMVESSDDVSNNTEMDSDSGAANEDTQSASSESPTSQIAPVIDSQPSTGAPEPSSPATTRVDFDITRFN